ncbi:hypothetical protein INR49_026424 [Caranx melampygus]|nr:hypothetical protein INR49_026424 [Caranx melampygus]
MTGERSHAQGHGSHAVYYSSDWTLRCHSPGILRKGLQTAKMKHYESSGVVGVRAGFTKGNAPS